MQTQRRCLKIGVISDTHKKFKRAKKAIDFLLAKEVEYLIHAGDIVCLEVLEYLKSSGVRYYAVFGNNDIKLMEYAKEFDIKSEPYYFKIDGTMFKLMHHPFYLSPDVDVIIFGHTHNFECDVKNGRVFLNPGEVCARNKPISECAMIEIFDEKYTIHRYQRVLKSDEFITSIKEFSR
jgi:putative phosphoesterase